MVEEYIKLREPTKIRTFVKDIFNLVDSEELQNLNIEKNNLVSETLEPLKENYKILEDTYSDVYEDLQIAKNEIKILREQQKDNNDTQEVLEEFWNNKIPKTNISHACRYLPNLTQKINIDPRAFFNQEGITTKFTSGTNDEKAYKCLQHVKQTITYTSDSQFKLNELWLFAFETYALRKGDCEDGAIYLANVMIKSGIPYWRIRINAGDVKGGGHAWVTYLRESDNQWVILDWCYWYSESIKGLLWKDAEKYYKTWFSFNNKYSFIKDELDR